MAAQLTAGKATRRERAVALHDFVRDEIQFGFTPHFDWATPEDTLRDRRGHCNPQAGLLTALLNAADVPARQHFVLIGRDVLGGLGGFPQTLMHSYTEVDVSEPSEATGERWCKLDGYILDPPMREGARQRLAQGGERRGWGGHRDARGDWDGREQRVMSQMVSDDMVLEDLGATVTPAALYSDARNPQRLPMVVRWLAAAGFGQVNRKIESVRQDGRLV